MALRSPRLEALLGTTIDAIDATAVHRLIAQGAREDSDLEFKCELYGNTDSEKRDLATDVAAMSNGVGGLLVLGVQDVDGAAAAPAPVPLSDGESVRMEQILAGNVAPLCEYRIRRVDDGGGGEGFYMIEVPRSAHRPHAVRVNDGLRYPVRGQAGIRYLAESEVADAYRDRFRAAAGQIQRLDDVHTEGRGLLDRSDLTWLAVSVVPNNPGEVLLQRQTPKLLADWLRGRPQPGLMPSTLLHHAGQQTTTGLRRCRIIVPEHSNNPLATVAAFELHTDGSGFGALGVGIPLRDQHGQIVQPATASVDDEQLHAELAVILSALCGYAVERAHTGGDAVVRAELLTPIWVRPHSGPTPLALALMHERRGNLGTRRWSGTSLVVDHAPRSEHTIDIDGPATDARELLLTTRLVVTDLLQALGLAESPQIDPDGSIRIGYLQQAYHQTAKQWAEANGIAVVDTAL